MNLNMELIVWIPIVALVWLALVPIYKKLWVKECDGTNFLVFDSDYHRLRGTLAGTGQNLVCNSKWDTFCGSMLEYIAPEYFDQGECLNDLIVKLNPSKMFVIDTTDFIAFKPSSNKDYRLWLAFYLLSKLHLNVCYKYIKTNVMECREGNYSDVGPLVEGKFFTILRKPPAIRNKRRLERLIKMEQFDFKHSSKPTNAFDRAKAKKEK